MKRREVVRAVCFPLAVAVGIAMVRDAENPHAEQKQHEEEPRMTYETPYTTSSGVTLPLAHDVTLLSVTSPALRLVKKVD